MGPERDPMFPTVPGSTLDGLCAPGSDGVEETTGSAERPRASAMEPGRRLGRYVVLGPLGHGGMGMVLKAYDETLDRVIALKLLLVGADERHAKRLTREAQALAKLSHPNVVHVYEVGQADGQWFIAMELIRGPTLRQWQQGEHDWREVVQVYGQAGAGLVAAHAAGLVHRDFKPDNCIIDELGHPKVLDFGLVREAGGTEPRPAPGLGVTDDPNPITASLTRDGAVLGTLAYMPLEQLSGKPADARSDQFSFCVSLYEALYERRPFGEGSVGELTAALVEGRLEPTPRGTRVPGRLRRVLLRGLCGDPDQRWPTMEALLHELRRVSARRRAGASGLVVGAGLLAVGIGLWSQAEPEIPCQGAEAQLDGVWDELRKQDVEAAVMGTGLPYAADTWARVEPAFDDYARRWAEAHTDACLATSVRKEQSAEVLDLRMGCLQQRRLELGEAVGVLANANPTRLQRAVTLVSGLTPLSRCDDIEGLRAELPPPEDAAEASRVEVLREQLISVRTLDKAGELEQGRAAVELVVEQADALGYRPLQGEAWLARGMLREQQGEYVEAEQDVEQAYLLAAELGHRALEVEAAIELTFVVGTRRALGERGLWWGSIAVALAKGRHQDDQALIAALDMLGTVRTDHGDLDAGLALHQEALALLEQSPENNELRLSTMLNNMGVALQEQQHFEQSLEHYRRALAIRERVLGSKHPAVGKSLNNIGSTLADLGDHAAALEHYRRALAIWTESLGPSHPHVAGVLLNLGTSLQHQGKLDEALDALQRALPIWEATVGPNHPTYAWTLGSIGLVLTSQGKLDEALDAERRALAILEPTRGPNHADVAMIRQQMGATLATKGDLDGAREQYQRALAIREEVLGPTAPHVASSLIGLAEVALAQGQLAIAREHAERAVAIQQSGDVGPEDRADAQFALARALWPEVAQRARARALVESARQGLLERADPRADYLARIDAWLEEHVVPVAP